MKIVSLLATVLLIAQGAFAEDFNLIGGTEIPYRLNGLLNELNGHVAKLVSADLRQPDPKQQGALDCLTSLGPNPRLRVLANSGTQIKIIIGTDESNLIASQPGEGLDYSFKFFEGLSLSNDAATATEGVGFVEIRGKHWYIGTNPILPMVVRHETTYRMNMNWSRTSVVAQRSATIFSPPVISEVSPKQR